LEKINFLRKIPLFKTISLSYLQPLLLQCRELNYKKGSIIYKKDESPIYFYSVSEGEIEVFSLKFSFAKNGIKKIDFKKNCQKKNHNRRNERKR